MNVRRLRGLAAATAVASLTAVTAACGGGDATGGQGAKVRLALVAYSTPQAAYEKIIKAYQATPAGKNITFTKSFGGSGDQSRAVEAGLQADIVAFSLEPDMTRLVKKGLVAEDWNTGPTKGMVTDSVVVIATRKGNPKNLKTWDDLTKPGIEVITPNPFTSGGARWNVLAGYGAKSNKGADEEAGVAYLKALFANVPVQDDSARKSLQTFSTGKGDAILAYENEAIFAQQSNQPLEYTVPDSTILIENPVAVTKNSKHPAEAKAFLDFLYSADAQKIFAENGYRPVTKDVPGAAFPTPPALFTIADLGGWPKVTAEFFDPKGSIMADIERGLGVSIEK
ncbi:sulfate ABC transporter substrate-binding protein [Planomonospora sp. ID67723]|uniref:sulfate ABC transporter substrate-binding protein n=1 Tax=Planomonospora sp. ID67723 TaxID=2738134 RepID=UPI0018C3B9AA|nr:sulfate ABC transporter substrate-binding protein [Planomonospora sp. ID67723]MBG0830055.1 sulfate ABC transporter substrate-binding protein [Planomonospora sp. ID67723]